MQLCRSFSLLLPGLAFLFRMQVIHPSTWSFLRSLVPLPDMLPMARKLSSLCRAPQPDLGSLLYLLGG